MTRRLIALAAAAGAAALVAVPTIGTGQAPAGRDIVVREKVLAIGMNDVAPTSKKGRLSIGDTVVTRQSLRDVGGARIGTLFTNCAGVGPTAPLLSATLLCTTTYRFGDGQIVAMGVTRLSPGGRLTIVGGSGAYASARGEVEFAAPMRGDDSQDIIHLAG